MYTYTYIYIYCIHKGCRVGFVCCALGVLELDTRLTPQRRCFVHGHSSRDGSHHGGEQSWLRV